MNLYNYVGMWGMEEIKISEIIFSFKLTSFIGGSGERAVFWKQFVVRNRVGSIGVTPGVAGVACCPWFYLGFSSPALF